MCGEEREKGAADIFFCHAREKGCQAISCEMVRKKVRREIEREAEGEGEGCAFVERAAEGCNLNRLIL